jgi:hypothetical protein
MPYLENRENLKEILNMYLFLLFSYTLPGFTSFILEPEDRYLLGYLPIGILSVMVLINLTLAIIFVC